MTKEAKKLEFRTLKADEIECRVGTVKKNKSNGEVEGFSLLLYKDARVDQRLLDEVVGAYNWKNHYEVQKNVLHCIVEIWDEEKGAWISKQNCGTESNTEAQKGEASDAFKRACFNWGIGRELYDSPFIWINVKDVKDGYNQYSKFIVKELEYDENRKVKKLVIAEQRSGNEVFTYGQVKQAAKKAATKKEQPAPKTAAPKQEKGESNEASNIDEALLMVRNCETIDELKKVWVDNETFQKDGKFTTAVTERKNQINGSQTK